MNSSVMNTFLRGHALTEDELILCDSLPANKFLEAQVKMVWPWKKGALRAQFQFVPCKDRCLFEVVFHGWPEEHKLKVRDSVLMLLRGATKSPMLSQSKNKDKEEDTFSFRIFYRNGAMLRVQREEQEIVINFLEEPANVQRESVSVVERMDSRTEIRMDQQSSERQSKDLSVNSSPPKTHSISRPPSPPPKKARRNRRRHKSKPSEQSNTEQENEIIMLGVESSMKDSPARNPADSAFSVHPDPLPDLPASYTGLGMVAYKNMYSVIGIVRDAGIIKPTKTGDIVKSIILVDSSTTEGLTINVFAEKENQSLLPSANRGQLLLLRNVYIQKFNEKVQGTCYKDRTQWCGYDPVSGEPFYPAAEAMMPDGVSFSITSEELHYFARLAGWWNALTEDNINITFPRRLVEGRKLRFISELQEYIFSDCLVELLKVQHVDERRCDIFVTDFSENPALQCFDTSDFPLGKRTLKVTLWEDARSLADSLIPGNIYLLENMKVKSMGFLEASVGGYGFRGIEEISSESSQPNLSELLARKQAYENNPSSGWLRPNSPGPAAPAPLCLDQVEIIKDIAEPIIKGYDTHPSLVTEIVQSNDRSKTFRLKCQIADYYPRDIKDFVYIHCTICGKRLAASSKRCLECGDMSDTAALFTYRFVLRVVDGDGNGLNVRVSGKEADIFLNNLPAKEVVENSSLLLQRLEPVLGHLYKFHETLVREDKTDGPWLDLTLFSYTLDNNGRDVYYKLTGCSAVNRN